MASSIFLPFFIKCFRKALCITTISFKQSVQYFNSFRSLASVQFRSLFCYTSCFMFVKMCFGFDIHQLTNFTLYNFNRIDFTLQFIGLRNVMDKNQFNHIEDINQEQLQQVLNKLNIYHRKSSEILAASKETQAQGTGKESDKIIDHPLIIQKRQTTTQILTDVMSKYRKEILWYLKAKFIYEEILQPIQSQQCLILSDQTNIQFMYLGYQRSLNFLYLSESSFKNSENLHIETNYLVSSIQSLLLKVKNQFDRYFKMLTLKEGTFWSTIWTWSSSLFDSKSKQRRDIIFCGFEGLDFSPPEQIAYTQQFYIPIIHERISKAASFKKKLLAKILNYQNILETDCSHIASFDDFENIKESIVSKAIESI